MADLRVQSLPNRPIEAQDVELVERKGLGHPDAICDALAEAISRDLCRHYLASFGRVAHYNIENGFLVAGRSRTAFGGGQLEQPMRFVFGDSATAEVDGRSVPVAEIARGAVEAWIAQNLPLVEPGRHLLLQNELHAGSAQLADLFARERPAANDTCVGCGYAPATETESIVLETERVLVSDAFRERFPQAGPDVKVTAIREVGRLTLIISLAFVDRRISGEAEYFDVKAAAAAALEAHVRSRLRRISELRVHVNTADRAGCAEVGLHLTVLGTSAENGDGGQVGRGNRPSGVNAYARPLATGGVAGKNPAANVGKIYSLFAFELARRIALEVEDVAEAYVSIVGRIGAPLEDPYLVDVRVVSTAASGRKRREKAAAGVVAREFARVSDFARRLAHGAGP